MGAGESGALGTIDDDVTVIRPPARASVPVPIPVASGAATARTATPGLDPDATVIHPGTAQRPSPHANLPASVPAPSPMSALAPMPARPPAQGPGAPLYATRRGAALGLPEGFRLLEYRIDGLLGQGGFGLTYLATDVNLHTLVAIKEYLPEAFAFRKSTQTVSANASENRERYQQGLDGFLVEARTLATFRHPHIVRVARFFEAHQTAYMVLEYERGQSLKGWWPQHRALPEKDLVVLLAPLLDGLSVVHEAGFLHRDIKPDNINVRQSDGSLVLLDFGSARQATVAAADVDSVLTPGYAPIEQYHNGGQGPWTDIYGLAATLYWMVSAHKPPEPTARFGTPDPMTPALEAGQGRYSEAFLKAIDWALCVQPQDRPQTVQAFRQALFAAHAASLGLQEALRSGEADGAQEVSALRRARGIAGALRRVARPSSWPLSVKMTVAMVLTALLPMLVTGVYNLRGSLDALSQSELNNLEQLARSTAGRVSQLVSDSQNLARSMGTDAEFTRFLQAPSDAGRATMHAKLVALVHANPDIQFIMLMDAGGTALVASDPEVSGKNFRFREYFKSAMAGQPFTSGILVGSVAGAAGVFYAYPVEDEVGLPVGAVVMRLKADPISAILDEVRAGSGRIPFMVDGDGVLVQHPDKALLYDSLVPLSADRMAAIRADQRFRRNEIRSLGSPQLAKALVGAKAGGHLSYDSPVSGQPEVVGFAPVHGKDWVVGVSENRRAFEAPLRQLYQQLLASLALVGMLFLGLALRFSRSIVRPIQALTQAATALKNGDYAAATVVVRSKDEIGQLARTFNVMIDVLRQREREHARGAKAGRG